MLTGAAILGSTIVVSAGSTALNASATTSRLISASGTTSFTSQFTPSASTAAVEQPELQGSGGDPLLAPDRSNSVTDGGVVGASNGDGSGTVAASNPELNTSFDGLNHYTQRFGVDNGNQFSLEPPDQGLCAANGKVLETINDVEAVFNTDGSYAAAPMSLNQFYGYPSAILRTGTGADHNKRGPFVTDPSCLYDTATGRWFHVVLTLEDIASGAGAGRFLGPNHLDIAVSQTSDPTGAWNIYRIPVQDDGTDGTPDHHCSGTWYDGTANNACLGDYPHIGADANGFYVTTNEYSFFGNDFHGAQLYAMSKTALESGGPVNVNQIDTNGMDNGNSGFTLAPAQVPDGGSQESAAGGTEYFLSSNAADEAHGNGAAVGPRKSNQILVWALSDTSALAANSAVTLPLKHTTQSVGGYTVPPSSPQHSGATPLKDCLNNQPCNTALNGFGKDPFTEKEYNLDSNDSRMLQTTFAAGKLWGALDTGLNNAGNNTAAVEWFQVSPSTDSAGNVSVTASKSGYEGLSNSNLTYPAIGVTSAGRAVMAFTVTGGSRFPSAGYALLGSNGAGVVHVIAAGAGPADGFSGYALENYPDPARPRWGDYGAAAVVGNQVWLASEYIGQTCSLATYEATNFRCGNTRTALGNWDTRISLVTP